ncbi:hypothetical protein SCHPADRAFT_864804 [Schizopora paradoxa]|uniref:Centrosomin N-terminal motif 1 domain-containing protein n=1 Tax=Schizopora paradoxa TaxID=27342 RepID=A0A0H2SRK2_9AGAM|nr:hypothetical protein SCHPADRAFT_864804 [Schizopora paradoxa]
MSASNGRGDSSNQSSGTTHDFSLGSLASFQSPAHFRVPSASSGTSGPSTAPINTPSPPSNFVTRRKTDEFVPGSTPVGKRLVFTKPAALDDDDEADALETPARDTKADAGSTPMPNRTMGGRKASGVGGKPGSNLTLRDQEKHIDALKKENFNIKLKVHFLEERLAQLAPDQIDAALKQNINLKIEVQQRGLEMKKYKKLVLELERELERLQRGKGKEREYEDRIAQLEQELRDARRRKGSSSHADESLLQRQNEELEHVRDELEEEVENLREALHNRDVEMDELREELERGARPRDSSNGVAHERVEQLEAEVDELQAQLEDCNREMQKMGNDNDELEDINEGLRLQLVDMERRLERDMAERSESRAQILEERDEREELERSHNDLRDKLASSTIQLNSVEDELQIKEQALQEMEEDQHRLASEFEDVLEEYKIRNEELLIKLEGTEMELNEMRDHLSGYEEETEQLKENFEMIEQQLNERAEECEALRREIEEKEVVIARTNSDIDNLTQQVFVAEDERDTLEAEKMAFERDTKERIDQLEIRVNAYKVKLEECRENLRAEKEKYEELLENYNQRERDFEQEIRDRETLAQHVTALVDEVRKEREAREKAEDDIIAARKEHDAELRRLKREVEAKESALRSALDDYARTQSLLDQRETDFAEAQEMLKTLEDDHRKLDESIATDRFTVQLDVDRLRRDVERLESELTRARMELANREAKTREREDELDKLHSENRDLAAQLSSQTQARLNATEKLDGVQATLRAMETENASQKQRVGELEARLSKDQRSLMNTENQYRDQLTERNTLLLTIYQYMDKILGVDKTPKGETKPFTNFSVFHDNLISRLKSLSQIQLDFDKKCKVLETKYTDKMSDLRKQLDARWKQLDKFDTIVKNLAEHKQGWKKRLATKEGEIEALKSTNSELSSQISGLKRPGQGESFEIKSLKARATTAEKQVIIAKNQVAALEERKSQEADTYNSAREKWEARLKELESRYKAAEERVKRERQGAKENNAALQSRINDLQRQLELANKRKHLLDDMIESNKPPSSSSPK